MMPYHKPLVVTYTEARVYQISLGLVSRVRHLFLATTHLDDRFSRPGLRNLFLNDLDDVGRFVHDCLHVGWVREWFIEGMISEVYRRLKLKLLHVDIATVPFDAGIIEEPEPDRSSLQ
jgi:hypothetical protein